MKIEAIKRAIKYEERARVSENKLVKQCIEERERESGKRKRGKMGKNERRIDNKK